LIITENPAQVSLSTHSEAPLQRNCKFLDLPLCPSGPAAQEPRPYIVGG
jgi:hypothetical protein